MPRRIQLSRNPVNFKLDVFDVLFCKSLVFEECFAQVVSNICLEHLKILLIQLSRQDIRVELLYVLLHLAQHSFLDSIRVHIGLHLLEHLIVLRPIVFKADVVFDDQVNHVEVGQDLAQIVENGPVADLFEGLLVHSVF